VDDALIWTAIRETAAFGEMMRIVILAMMATAAFGQITKHPPRPKPREFAIMAWGDSPSDLQQLEGMRDAGLNISGFCRAADLEKVKSMGLTCFVEDQFITSFDPLRLPPDDEIRRGISSLGKQVAGNPAALGFFLRDEPSAAMMPGLGRLAALIHEAMPEMWPYVNLFPSRVSAERLGTNDYDSYVRLLVKALGQPFLSYDNYSLVNGEMLDYFYTNLEIVRRLGLETSTPFWNCILANSHFNYMEPSDATFNLQVYATVAYGGRGIQYFTYFAPTVGNYRLAAIDQFGNRTATWDMLRRINNQIHALAPTLVGLHSTGVYHYPDVPDQAQALANSKLIESVELTQRLVKNPISGRFLVGEFEDSNHRPYFMIVNKDLRNSFQFNIHLRQKDRKLIRVSPYSGEEEPFGGEMDWLAPGSGILFRVEPPPSPRVGASSPG
jgi:hypothetical protein